MMWMGVNAGLKAQPLSDGDRETLRTLAERVSEIAMQPEQKKLKSSAGITTTLKRKSR